MTEEELKKKIEELEAQNKKLQETNKPDDLEKKLQAERDQAKKAQEDAEKARKELEEVRKAQEEAEKKKLEDKNDFKGLYQKAVTELEETRKKQLEQQTKLQEEKKGNALLKHLQSIGIKEEYKDKALRLANIKAVGVDETNGMIYGHEAESERVKKEFPDLFGEKSTLPPSNKVEKNDKPPGGKLTIEDWKKLPYDKRREREQELFS